jgi:hypothetical protein
MAFVIGSDLGATWATIGFHDVPLLLATKRAAALAGGDGQEPVGGRGYTRPPLKKPVV